MPSIIFQGGPMKDAIVCEYQADGELSVLDLARRHAVPIYWRCGRGTCSACAARVQVLHGPIRPMGRREHNVLLRERLPVDLVEGAANWRLTCSYILSGESLRVHCPEEEERP